MQNLLLVGLGGFVGAVSRYLVVLAVRSVHGDAAPVGTLLANVVGCALAGGLLALAEERGALADPARLLVVVGFLGAFTTFSAFGVDAVLLQRGGHLGLALAYVAANVVLGLAAVLGARALTVAWL